MPKRTDAELITKIIAIIKATDNERIFVTLVDPRLEAYERIADLVLPDRR